MKVLLTTLNSKYSHVNIAQYYLRKCIEDLCDVEIKHFTINDNLENILESILQTNANLVCFGCYIWTYPTAFHRRGRQSLAGTPQSSDCWTEERSLGFPAINLCPVLQYLLIGCVGPPFLIGPPVLVHIQAFVAPYSSITDLVARAKMYF